MTLHTILTTACLLALFVCLGCTVVDTKQEQEKHTFAQLEFRLAQHEPGAGFVEMRMRDGSAAVYVSQTAIVGTSDFARVHVLNDTDGEPTLGFQLTEPASERFGEATEANVGKGLALLIDGDVVMVATITSRIVGDGQIDGLTYGEVSKLAREINGH